MITDKDREASKAWCLMQHFHPYTFAKSGKEIEHSNLDELKTGHIGIETTQQPKDTK